MQILNCRLLSWRQYDRWVAVPSSHTIQLHCQRESYDTITRFIQNITPPTPCSLSTAILWANKLIKSINQNRQNYTKPSFLDNSFSEGGLNLFPRRLPLEKKRHFLQQKAVERWPMKRESTAQIDYSNYIQCKNYLYIYIFIKLIVINYICQY